MLLALALLVPSAWSGSLDFEPGWLADQWTIRDGLPSDTVFAVAEDPIGAGLLLGTPEGLVRFDGRRFTALEGGPPDEPVTFLLPDRSHGLWLVTASGAVQHRTGTRIRDYGRLGAATRPVRVARGLPPLACTDAGVYALVDPPVLRTEFPAGTESVSFDGQEVLADTGHGFAVAPRLGAPFVAVEPSVGQARFAELDLQRRRARPYTFGPDTIRRGTTPLVPLAGPTLDVLKLADETWVATGGAGLLRVRRTPLRVHAPPPGVTAPTRVLRDPLAGGIWASDQASGRWWSPGSATAHFTRVHLGGREYPVSERPDLLPIAATSGRRWWWSTEGARLQRSDDDGDTLVLDAPATAPCPETLGALWSLPGGGLSTALGDRLVGGAWHSREVRCSKALSGVRAAVALPGLGALVGGSTGLFRIPDHDGGIVALPGARPWNTSHLRSDGERVWMAAETDGLCTLEITRLETGDWRCLGSDDGLGDAVVHASFEDTQGRTWVSSDRGLEVADTSSLAAFARGERAEVPFLTLGTSWGLPAPGLVGSAGFAGVTAEASLLFPGRAGLVEVEPAALTIPTTLRARLVPDLPRTLPTDHAPVTADIIVDPVSWADEVELRYRVGDGPWISTGPDLRLASLPPGTTEVLVEGLLIGDWVRLARATIHREPRPTERAVFLLRFVALGLAIVAAVGVVRSRMGGAWR